MKRRTFLKHTAHTISIPALLGTFGYSALAQSLVKSAAEENKVLVLIYLQGGNDGLNTLIPLDQMEALNAVRQHVVMPENKLLKLEGADLALHPSLDGLRALYNEERLRIIQSVGYPEQNFSHFRSTDIWMSASESDELVNSGWTGRYLDERFPGYPNDYPNQSFTDPLSIEIGYGSTMLFQGPNSAMSMVLTDPNDFYGLLENNVGEVPDTNAGDKLKHIRLTARQSQLYGDVVKNAANKISKQKEYPNTDLAQQLKIIARLLAGGLETPVYLVKIDGFDTHSEQVSSNDHTKGKHAELLKEVNDAILAFMNDLEFQGVGDKVLGMTFSEFGRRIVSNASEGTDHGAAAPMFIFGNKVQPGILGENPSISMDATYKDNLEWQYDFRQVYSSMLEQWFNLDLPGRSKVLFKDFESIPIVKSGPTVSVDDNFRNGEFQVFPNPVRNLARVSFVSSGKSIRIDACDLNGKIVSFIFKGKINPGKHTIQWDAHNLPPGNYLLVFRGESFKKAIKVIKTN